MVFDSAPRIGGEGLPDVRTLTPVAARLLDEGIADFDWTAFPPGLERLRFEAPSGALAGSGVGSPDDPRFLLLPGLAGSKEDYALVAALLMRAGYRVEGFDPAGQYESADAGPERLDPPRPRYDWELFADDLVAVLRAGRTPAHVVATSFMGVVAQLVAGSHPELFASLTLVSAPPAAGQVLAKALHWAAPLSLVLPPRSAAALLRARILGNYALEPEHRFAIVRQRLESPRPEQLVDVMRMLRRVPDAAAGAAGLAVPKLVVCASNDWWSPRRFGAFAERIGAEALQYELSGGQLTAAVPHQFCADLVRVIERDA